MGGTANFAANTLNDAIVAHSVRSFRPIFSILTNDSRSPLLRCTLFRRAEVVIFCFHFLVIFVSFYYLCNVDFIAIIIFVCKIKTFILKTIIFQCFLYLFYYLFNICLIMTGEELKQYIKQSGMTITDVAKEMGTTPQNFGAKLTRKSVRADLIMAVKNILDKCAPPLPIEMETAVLGSNINGPYSPNVQQSTSNNAALEAENKLLKQQNHFLQQQVERLTSLLENK